MDKIYLITRSEGSCQSDYRENAVKAFADQTLAEAHVLELKAIDARYNEIGKAANVKFHAEFMPKHPFPKREDDLASMKEPKWNPKLGSKKVADPEVLKEFEARESEYRDYCRARSTPFHAAILEWQAAATTAINDFLRDAGATEDEITGMFTDRSPMYFSLREYDYTVDDLPFQG